MLSQVYGNLPIRDHRSIALDNPIHPLCDEEAGDAKDEQTSRDAPEPDQIVFALTGHEDVHAPHAGDNIHWQNNCTQDRELAQNIGCLLLALVHADVDLGEVVGMSTREKPEDTRSVSASFGVVTEKTYVS